MVKKNETIIIVPFTLGILSKKTGVPKSTLRYWQEKYDLFQPIARDEQGNPLYDRAVVERVKKIKLFRNSGLEIAAVGNKLFLGNPKPKKYLK